MPTQALACARLPPMPIAQFPCSPSTWTATAIRTYCRHQSVTTRLPGTRTTVPRTLPCAPSRPMPMVQDRCLPSIWTVTAIRTCSRHHPMTTRSPGTKTTVMPTRALPCARLAPMPIAQNPSTLSTWTAMAIRTCCLHHSMTTRSPGTRTMARPIRSLPCAPSPPMPMAHNPFSPSTWTATAIRTCCRPHFLATRSPGTRTMAMPTRALPCAPLPPMPIAQFPFSPLIWTATVIPTCCRH